LGSSERETRSLTAVVDYAFDCRRLAMMPPRTAIPDGAERAVRSGQFRNNLQSHDWPIRQADLACSSLVMNSHFSLSMYPI
jgi:hypothetical protein